MTDKIERWFTESEEKRLEELVRNMTPMQREKCLNRVATFYLKALDDKIYEQYKNTQYRE